MTAVGEVLERLYREVDVPTRLAADPVSYPHRYDAPEDQEIAAVFAASLAYGRVAGFRAVLDVIFAQADARGGPAAWVRGFDPVTDGDRLRPLVYRWNRGEDFVVLVGALQRLSAGGSLERFLVGDPLPDALDAWIGAVRSAAAEAAGVGAFEALPRGFRSLLPRPADGSACKRWWMFLRWMIRPNTEGLDLGLWRSRSPAELVVPLDTHVLRIAQFLGLTRRRDGSGRTAREVTEALRRLDPADPVRFDFAIAHLGISRACLGHREAAICAGCALDPACAAPPG
ncbi:MAG: TIGR02757 family protein [Myxococcota bacterium]